MAERFDSKKIKRKHKKQHGLTVHILRSAAVLIPVIFALLSAYFAYSKYHTFLPGIIWNDESVYLKLVKLYSRYSAPLGYYGFDGNHAILGTGSAWSSLIIWPYSMLYKLPVLAKSGYSFVYVANLIFITFANYSFIYLTKPKRNQAIRLIIIQITSVVLLLYLNTNMSELFRFSLAIIIAGMIYKMMYLKSQPLFKYVIVPVFILYACQVYTFFVFAVFAYVCALKKEYNSKRDVIWQCVYALIATGFTGALSYYILHNISSNYNIGKTEKLMAAFTNGQYLGMLKELGYMVFDGMKGMYNLCIYYLSNPIYLCHMITAVTIIIAGLVIALRNKGGDRALSLVAVASLIIFFAGYATLYTIVPDTFLRGTEIVMLFALYLLAMSEDRWIIKVVLIVNAIGMLTYPQNYKVFCEQGRYFDAATIKEWDDLADCFSSQITVKGSENPWDNTVFMCTMEPKVIQAIPDGMGINFVLYDYQYLNKPAYQVFTKHNIDKSIKAWVEKDYDNILNDYEGAILSDYNLQYDDGEYVIYARKNL